MKIYTHVRIPDDVILPIGVDQVVVLRRQDGVDTTVLHLLDLVHTAGR